MQQTKRTKKISHNDSDKIIAQRMKNKKQNENITIKAKTNDKMFAKTK